jgi:hypothetical protein
VCVSGTIWEQVKEGFAARDEAGRAVPLKGIGVARVWDVIRTR